MTNEISKTNYFNVKINTNENLTLPILAVRITFIKFENKNSLTVAGSKTFLIESRNSFNPSGPKTFPIET